MNTGFRDSADTFIECRLFILKSKTFDYRNRDKFKSRIYKSIVPDSQRQQTHFFQLTKQKIGVLPVTHIPISKITGVVLPMMRARNPTLIFKMIVTGEISVTIVFVVQGISWNVQTSLASIIYQI